MHVRADSLTHNYATAAGGRDRERSIWTILFERTDKGAQADENTLTIPFDPLALRLIVKFI